MTTSAPHWRCLQFNCNLFVYFPLDGCEILKGPVCKSEQQVPDLEIRVLSLKPDEEKQGYRAR